MKKRLLFGLSLTLLMLFSVTLRAQDTIAAWTFPTGNADDKYCNLGTEENVGSYDLRATNTDDEIRELAFTEHNEDFAAQATGWHEGDSTKFWMIRFKAESYKNLTVSSLQRSDGVQPGPRDFAIEYKLGNGDWNRIDGGQVVAENNWSTGITQDLALPEVANRYPKTIFIRWIMTSDSSAYASEVTEDGISWIDDIFVKGTFVPPNPQPIMAGWSFPNAFTSEFTPDTSIEANADFELELLNANTGESETFNMGGGYSSFAAYASDWRDKVNIKYWMVKFKTDGYIDINFSSRQAAKADHPGPASFKVQYRIGGGEWNDVDDAEVDVDDSWNTGYLKNIPLPESCWDTTASVYLRWLATSNQDFQGNTLADNDVSIIDDIKIRGSVNTIGTDEFPAPEELTVAPIPAETRLRVESSEMLRRVTLFTLQGKQITTRNIGAQQWSMPVDVLKRGSYLLRIEMKSGYTTTKKVLVR